MLRRASKLKLKCGAGTCLFAGKMKIDVVQLKARTSLVAITLAGLALGLSACSQSKKSEPAPPSEVVASNAPAGVRPAVPEPKALPPVVLTNGPAAPATNPAPSATNLVPSTTNPANAAASERSQRLATLEKKYQAAQSFDDRFDVVLAIGKVGNAEAVQMLEQLFRTEKNSEVRTELINALIDIGGCKDEKLALLRQGIAADQAADTREAALDGLVDLVDARALALLKELTTDPNEQVRSVAQQNYALLTEMLKAP